MPGSEEIIIYDSYSEQIIDFCINETLNLIRGQISAVNLSYCQTNRINDANRDLSLGWNDEHRAPAAPFKVGLKNELRRMMSFLYSKPGNIEYTEPLSVDALKETQHYKQLWYIIQMCVIAPLEEMPINNKTLNELSNGTFTANVLVKLKEAAKNLQFLLQDQPALQQISSTESFFKRYKQLCQTCKSEEAIKLLYNHRPTKDDISQLLKTFYKLDDKDVIIASSLAEVESHLSEDWSGLAHFIAFFSKKTAISYTKEKDTRSNTSHNKIFLVNLDQKNPFWIIMQKKPEGLIACVPKTIEIDKEYYRKISDLCITIKKIDLPEKNPLDERENFDLEPMAQWHTALLGKVLFWHISNNNMSLCTTVPLSLMNLSLMLHYIPQNQWKDPDAEALALIFFGDTFKQSKRPKVEKAVFLARMALSAFHNDSLSFNFSKSKDCPRLVINQKSSFLSILPILYRYSLTHLELNLKGTPHISGVDCKIFQILLKNNTSLIHIEGWEQIYRINELNPIQHCMEHAARNRFLQEMGYSIFSWNNAGEAIANFFKNQEENNCIDTTFIRKLSDCKKNKLQLPKSLEQGENTPYLRFLEIANMGLSGLNALFSYLGHASNLPLNLTFDLSDDLPVDTVTYIQILRKKINELYQKFKMTPVFAKFTLILPDINNQIFLNALMDLIKLIDKRHLKLKSDTNEIILHNVGLKSIIDVFSNIKSQIVLCKPTIAQKSNSKLTQNRLYLYVNNNKLFYLAKNINGGATDYYQKEIVAKDLNSSAGNFSKIKNIISETAKGNIVSNKITESDELNLLTAASQQNHIRLFPLQLMIKIPMWDASYTEQVGADVAQAAYHLLQNKINENRRITNSIAILSSNTQSLYLYQNGELIPKLKLRNATKAQELQQWDESEDVLYPLTQQLGVQYQVQEQQQEQQEQDQQHVQEEEHSILQEHLYSKWEEQEPIQPIAYVGERDHLVTRQTIDSDPQLSLLWNALSEIKKKKYKSMANLFSLWVGSDCDAPHTIQKIQRAAVKRIMQDLSQFLFGIVPENLYMPAGFSVEIYDGDLVLCFNSDLEQIKLAERAALPLEERNPFIIELVHAKRKKPTVFNGDFRQFSKIVGEKEIVEQQTLWKFLALEDETDQIRLDNNKNFGNIHSKIQRDVIDISAAYQGYTLSKKITFPKEKITDCLNLLRAWVGPTLHANQQENAYLTLLFGTSTVNVNEKTPINGELNREKLFQDLKRNTLNWNEKNLKALGQLFHHYGMIAAHPQKYNAGLACFFFIAKEMVTVFGVENCKIWKKVFLDTSQNWSELLEDKDELDAIFLSFATLKGKEPDIQTAWWLLVDAQYRATRSVRYADLWYAFQHVIGYLKEKNLQINLQSIENYLKKRSKFNAKIFLLRLYQVLKNASVQFYNHDIQQYILNHLHEMVWRHNAFYYASHYQRYPYWHINLELGNFYLSEPHAPTYQPMLDKLVDNLGQIYVQALRFACQRLQLNIHEFIAFDTLLNEFCLLPKITPEKVRLWMQCVAIGVDSWDDLVTNTNAKAEIKFALNKQTNIYEEIIHSLLWRTLDTGELQPRSLQIRFVDIDFFLEKLSEPLRKRLLTLNEVDRMTFINACGRALHCYVYFKYGQKNTTKLSLAASRMQRLTQLQKLLSFIEQNESSIFTKEKVNFPTVLTDYPWLIDSEVTLEDSFNQGDDLQVAKQQQRFKEQLRSINFTLSKWLPDAATLTTMMSAIINEASRHEQISLLVNHGCMITLQDALFRPLTPEESKNSIRNIECRFETYFRQQNIPLCQLLLSKHVAISSDKTKAKNELEQISGLLASLDNQREYNQLGQMLGLLISKASSEGFIRYYAAPQLIEWLQCFMHVYSSGDKHAQFPLNLLDNLLTHTLHTVHPQLTGFLSHNLHQLTAKIFPTLQKEIKAIIDLELRSEYKPLLMSLALSANPFLSAQEITGLLLSVKSPVWLNAFYQYLTLLVNQKNSISLAQLKLSLTVTSQIFAIAKPEPTFNALWERSQIKLITLLFEQKIAFERCDLQLVTDPSDAYVRIIMMQTCFSQVDYDKLYDIKNKLKLIPLQDLIKLADYCVLHSMFSCDHLVVFCNQGRNVEQFIEHFEKNIQATTVDGKSKRTLAVSSNLLRVLPEFKDKAKGAFISDKMQKRLLADLVKIEREHQFFRFGELTTKELVEKIRVVVAALSNKSNETRNNLQLLACLRELILRKTGKWLKNTQMLIGISTILYPPSEGNFLYQVRTGEGKSLIALLRVTYLALMGNNVDVFSTKEALSLRDYEEAKPVLTALNIAHSYITAASPLDAYKFARPKGIGTANFATPANLALYRARHSWSGEIIMAPNPKQHCADGDEFDLILSEKTQFNFSVNPNDYDGYNLDAWVYEEAYLFYLEYYNSFKRTQTGQFLVSLNLHLRALFIRLQQRRHEAHEGSRFFETYLLPTIKGKDENKEVTFTERDMYLLQLLSAAHIASRLKEESQYCVCDKPTIRYVKNKPHSVRIANVVVGKQVIEGATYSHWVHQLLHTMLNLRAIEKGETPDFFIEPCSDIAFSQNFQSVIGSYYYALEGRSATLGNRAQLTIYQASANVNQVMKLPTHQASQTKFLSTMYCKNKAEHIQAIVEHIRNAKGQPILITCEDDGEVKRITQKVAAKLSEEELQWFNLIEDTNDKNRSENKLVPEMGRCNAVTFSARVGRGTDIKPEATQGLKVIRTYPDTAIVVKQENGRQGRDYAGTCIEIINYDAVLNKRKFYRNNHKLAYSAIYKKESAHLQDKFDKHKRKGSDKWDWLNCDTILQKKYLRTRTVKLLQQEIEQSAEKQFTEYKDDLLAALSTHIISLRNASMNLKDRWLGCRSAITIAFRNRLANQVSDNDAVYAVFLNKATSYWQALCRDFPKAGLDTNLVSKTHQRIIAMKQIIHAVNKNVTSPLSTNMSPIPIKDASLKKMLHFYVIWLQKTEQYLATHPQRNKLCGDNDVYSLAFLDALTEKEPLLVNTERDLFFTNLKRIFSNEIAYRFSFRAWSWAVPIMIHTAKCEKEKAIIYFNLLLSFLQTCFNKEGNISNISAHEIEKNDRLLSLFFEIAHLFHEKIDNERLINNLLLSEPSGRLDRIIKEVLSKNISLTTLFINHMSKEDFCYIIGRISTAKAIRSDANKKLLDYLTKNSVYFTKHSNAIPSLTMLFLCRQSLQRKQIPILPEDTNVLNELSPNAHEHLWYFLSKRFLPISQPDLGGLISKLEISSGSLLREIPTYISVAYVVNYWDDDPQVIKIAGDAFYHFLLIRGIIAANSTSTDRIQLLDIWVQQFERRIPSENKAFFEAITQRKYAVCSLDALLLLAKKELIPQENSDDYLIFVKALALNTNKNWGDYFSEFDKNQSERQAILSYLNAGLLDDLGMEFKNSCNTQYSKLAARQLKQPSIPHSAQQHRILLRQSYQKLIQFVQETNAIIQYSHNNEKIHELKSINDKLFVKNYIDCVNRLEIYCIDSLSGISETIIQVFSQLRISSNNSITSKTDWYINVFASIRTLQNFLLEEIKKTDPNREDEKRLYDIITQLYLRVTGDYLSDMDIILEDKNLLSTIIEKNLLHLLMSLEDQLYSIDLKNNICGQLLQHIDFCSSDIKLDLNKLTEFYTFLQETDRKKIPKQLHYLLDCIECFKQLSINDIKVVETAMNEPIQNIIVLDPVNNLAKKNENYTSNYFQEKINMIFARAYKDKTVNYIETHLITREYTPDIIENAYRAFYVFLIERNIVNLTLDSNNKPLLSTWLLEFQRRSPLENILFFRAIAEEKYKFYPINVLALLAKKEITPQFDSDAGAIFEKILSPHKLNEIFDDINKNQSERQTIMRYVIEGLLKGTPNEALCYEKYNNLAAKILLRGEIPKSDKDHHISLRQGYFNVIQFAQEIQKIVESSSAQESALAIYPDNYDRKYIKSIDKLKERYHDSWFKTPTCEAYANKLFRAVTLEKHYPSVLEEICKTQQCLLDAKSGDSFRLYNIATELFLQVAGDYLSNKAISWQLKKELNKLIQKQLVFHLNLLNKKSSYSAQLNKALGKKLRESLLAISDKNGYLNLGATELMIFHTALQNCNRREIPSEYHYLLDTIENFMQLNQCSAPAVDEKRVIRFI